MDEIHWPTVLSIGNMKNEIGCNSYLVLIKPIPSHPFECKQQNHIIFFLFNFSVESARVSIFAFFPKSSKITNLFLVSALERCRHSRES